MEIGNAFYYPLLKKSENIFKKILKDFLHFKIEGDKLYNNNV